MVSAKQLERLLTQIPRALDNGELNGREMDILGSIEAKLHEFGQKAVISEKEQYRLDQIFAKAGIYPEIDRGLPDL